MKVNLKNSTYSVVFTREYVRKSCIYNDSSFFIFKSEAVVKGPLGGIEGRGMIREKKGMKA